LPKKAGSAAPLRCVKAYKALDDLVFSGDAADGVH